MTTDVGLASSLLGFSNGHQKNKREGKYEPQTKRDESGSKAIGRRRTRMEDNGND